MSGARSKTSHSRGCERESKKSDPGLATRGEGGGGEVGRRSVGSPLRRTETSGGQAQTSEGQRWAARTVPRRTGEGLPVAAGEGEGRG